MKDHYERVVEAIVPNGPIKFAGALNAVCSAHLPGVLFEAPKEMLLFLGNGIPSRTEALFSYHAPWHSRERPKASWM